MLPYFDTILVDNSSPIKPSLVDVVLPNAYYSGLWNAAVSAAVAAKKDWLLFVASDVQIPNIDLVATSIISACSNRYTGLYTPSLRPDSRLAYSACFTRGTGAIRECFVCEGFFFLVRTKIVARLHPVDPSLNMYGWGIDAFTAYMTYKMGYRCVVDDRAQIYHPAATHEISIEDAKVQSARFMTPAALRFVSWSESQLNAMQIDPRRSAGVRSKVAHARWWVREILT